MDNPLKEATVCYLFAGNHLLTIERNKNKPDDPVAGYLSVPGGKMKPGQTPLENVCEEFFDETGGEDWDGGMRLLDPVLRGEITLVNLDMKTNFKVYVFTATRYSGALKPNHREGTVSWIPEKGWMGRNWRPSDHVYIPHLFGPDYFIARAVVAGNKILDSSIVFKR